MFHQLRSTYFLKTTQMHYENYYNIAIVVFGFYANESNLNFKCLALIKVGSGAITFDVDNYLSLQWNHLTRILYIFLN